MTDVLEKYDVIVVGAGVAGLTAARFLPRDKRVLVLTKEHPRHSDSYLAQGGICVRRDENDYDGFYEDTLRAGHGENSPEAVTTMIADSREIVDELIEAGVRFARDKNGELLYTREGGHRKGRILYHADCTGKEITSKLYAYVKKLPNVQIRPYTVMLDLLTVGGECRGVVVADGKTGKLKAVAADYVVLATGGVGGVFEFSTNYRSLTGDGVAVCAKHGVKLRDVDYIQIHPTTLYTKKRGRRFLVSESVRGEGAVLLDKNGERFTDELQPRDVVTAAIYAQMQKDGTKFVRLDLRTIPERRVREHFPNIVARCVKEGYDPFAEPIPVVPGQHYFMGGVESDTEGRTSMPRLFAVGETCCNGVHGKNRLASNSLLESIVFARRAARLIGDTYAPLTETEGKEATRVLDESVYADRKAWARELKETVRNEIEKWREKRAKGE